MRVDRAEPGHYKIRRGRAGAWVPVRIYEVPAHDPETKESAERAPTLACLVDGLPADIERVWPGPFRITAAEYETLCRERDGVVDGLSLREMKVRF